MFGIDDAIMLPMLGSVASGIFNNSAASSRQEDSQSFNAEQFATRYQTTIKDMQAAGLNPMLAYGGINGTGATSSAASSAGMSDLGSTYTAAKMANAQVANIAADTENKRAQASLIEAQVDQTRASAGQAVSGGKLADTQAAEIQKKLDLGYYEDDLIRLRALTHELWSQWELNNQKSVTEHENRRVMAETINKLRSETKLLDFDIDAAKALNNIGRDAKQLAPIIDLLKPFLMRR